MKIKTSVLLVAIVIGLSASAALQNLYDHHHQYSVLHDTFISLPSGKTLKIFSFGFDAITSDFLYIWAIQFYSTPTIKNRFEFAERIFNSITDLAPEYKDPYYTGSLIMSMDMNDIPATLRLLDKAINQFPRDWTFYNEAGYYSYKNLKDYKRAESYYSKAAAIPDAPDFIKRRKAHMVYLQNDLSVAWDMWMDIYRNSENRIAKTSAFNHLFQIKAEQDLALLKGKIEQFKIRYNQPPESFTDLVARGFLPSIPKDFSGRDYIYDAKTGEVKATKEYRWKRFR